MSFKLREYREPNFTQDVFVNAPDASYGVVEKDGVAPENYHAMSIYPEYFKVNGKWVLAEETRMDCVPIITNDDKIDVVEFRRLKVGDKVIVGRTENAKDGIYLYPNGFQTEEEAQGDVLHLDQEDQEKLLTLKIMKIYMNY